MLVGEVIATPAGKVLSKIMVDVAVPDQIFVTKSCIVITKPIAHSVSPAFIVYAPE